jgi:hypothetical protein
VDKTVNQPSTKHHGITKKLKQGLARSEAHRRALATTEMLPAARKKSVVSEFLAKSVDHSRLGGCARRRWS